ncbi:MAG: hypothetical protein ACE5KD_00755 [Candidatus Bathyarchaeia archaeon]
MEVSAVENIPGLEGNSCNYPNSINVLRLLELQKKLNKIFTEKIYAQLRIGSEISSLQYPQLFLEVGLRNIEVNGYLLLFSFSDSRYSVEEMLDYLRRDYENRFSKLAKNRRKYIQSGFTEKEFEEVLGLLKKKYRFLTENPKRIWEVMEIELRPRIIVSGVK